MEEERAIPNRGPHNTPTPIVKSCRSSAVLARRHPAPLCDFILRRSMPPGDEAARYVCAKANDQRDGQWKSTVKA